MARKYSWNLGFILCFQDISPLSVFNLCIHCCIHEIHCSQGNPRIVSYIARLSLILQCKGIVKRFCNHFSKCHRSSLKIHGGVFHRSYMQYTWHLESWLASFDNGRCLSGFMRLYGVERSIIVVSSIKEKDQQSEPEETCEVDIAGKSGNECLVSSILSLSLSN